MQKRIFLLSGLLVIIASIVIVNLKIVSFKRHAKVVKVLVPPPSARAPAVTSSKKETSAADKAATPEETVRKLIRDPFSPRWVDYGESDQMKGPIFAGLALTGILWDDRHPSAIINGEVVMAGESIDDKKILKIEKGRVYIKEGENEYILNLWIE